MSSLGRTGLQEQLSSSAPAEDGGVLSSQQSLLRCSSCPQPSWQTRGGRNLFLSLGWSWRTPPWELSLATTTFSLSWSTSEECDTTNKAARDTDLTITSLPDWGVCLPWICTSRRLWWKDSAR